MAAHATADAAALLQRIVAALGSRAPQLLPAPRRAAVAIIVRSVSAPEVLYIQRASTPGDPWSAHIAFPGGKRDASDASDRAAAEREVREEVGLDLRDGGAFSFVGGLHDRPVMSSGRAHVGYSYSVLVWVHASPHTPPLALCAGEVAGAAWVPLARICSPAARAPWAVERPAARLLPWAAPDRPRVSSAGGGEGGSGGSESGSSSGGALASSGADARASISARVARALALETVFLPALHLDAPPLGAPLWGMTLQATSDLVEAGGGERLNWPPLRSRNALVSAAVRAACGGIELWDSVSGARPWTHMYASHAAHLAAAALTVVACAASTAAWAADTVTGSL